MGRLGTMTAIGLGSIAGGWLGSIADDLSALTGGD
jgi:hypothetical protein